MTTDKDFKRLVRGRMQKTGEAYTTARIKLLQKTIPNPPPPAEPLFPSPRDYPRLAGMSDAAIKAKTGCTWERWVRSLDSHKADTWPHSQIAEFVHTKYKVGDWWAQTVTVGYERIKGLRAIGQRRDGAYEATKSKIFPVSVSRLYQAWARPQSRAAWLGEPGLVVRTARAGKSMRITWPDSTSVEVMFYTKAAEKSQVTIAHRKLPDRATSERMKAFWTERLAALSELLKGKAGSR
jgi:uncharacterized protein YndB with AHSA1/START domain